MPSRPVRAACVQSGPAPLTAPETTIVVIVLILATILALAGLPSLSVTVLLTEAAATGVKLAHKLRCVQSAALSGS
ncbi:hypothetical protein [Streptomyces sp. NPDC001415]